MSYDRDWGRVPKSRCDLKALKEILLRGFRTGKGTSGIEVVQLEHQASRRRFWLFRNARPTGQRGGNAATTITSGDAAADL